ncbi:HNH endonuclease [Pseudomonas sp. PDM23]|uniref:HNH endonuclease signature motif containing protein n=1 Tax=Pseudomonas sp. PDM23 TaxID=2769275 RepID=UPI00177F8445|nr:HNH endonuclease signature motif containing protein [Pseudomonas sp. PDM23]MBD9573731.1 HNH endonuclease [Pseudomonas sp. PDM23]
MEQARVDAKNAGAPRYSSNRPCKRGHVGLRYTSNGNCVQCDNEVLATRRRAKLTYTARVAKGLCTYCGDEFTKTNNANKFCSVACRFWSRVDRRGDDECWNWIGGKLRAGYGSFFVGNDCRVRAHVYSYEMANGPLPESVEEMDSRGVCVCHRCDNPGCVNPSHLFIGSHTDNMADMTAKGRHVGRRGMKKYGADVVLKVNELRALGMSQERIGWMLDIPQTIVSAMLRGMY